MDAVDPPGDPLGVLARLPVAPAAVSVTAVFLGAPLVDQDWGMSVSPFVLMWCLAVAAIGAQAVGHRLWPGDGWRWAHILVPVAVAVLAPFVAHWGGPVRDEWESVSLLAALAVVGHAGVTVLTSPRARLWARGAVVLVWVLALTATVTVERAAQERWRARDLEAAGVPLVVPQVPGFTLAGAAPGRYTRVVMVVLSDRPTDPYRGRALDVTITPTSSTYPANWCSGRDGQRYVNSGSAGAGYASVVLCPAGTGCQILITPRSAQIDLPSLLNRIEASPMSARALARTPRMSGWEPD
jgi:hypothetical protein